MLDPKFPNDGCASPGYAKPDGTAYDAFHEVNGGALALARELRPCGTARRSDV